jgi:hypothetical protein
MSAKLVEQTTKHSMNTYLRTLNKTSEYKQYLLFNLGVFVTLVFVVGLTLYLKYRERNNLDSIKKKEKDKQEFILNHLQLYQGMKSNYLY